MSVILKVCNVREVVQVYNFNASYCCTFTPFDLTNPNTQANKTQQRKKPTINKTQTQPTPIPIYKHRHFHPSLNRERFLPVGRNMYVNREILKNFSDETCRLFTLSAHRSCFSCNLNPMIATALLMHISLWS